MPEFGYRMLSLALIELERVISESAHMGPVIIAGDFNAHLGSMWGPRAHRSPNVQGILLGELLDRENLHAVSLSGFATGPSHTYCSGGIFSTVDYILAYIEASSCIECCRTYDDDDLNTSDHLPPSVTLSCHVATQFAQDPVCSQVNWLEAEKSGALHAFQAEVKDRLSPYIGRSHGSINQVEGEIKHVAWLIKDTAEKTLPLLKPKKPRRFRDRTLSKLCAKSKEAWRAWCEDGRPTDGPLYEAKCLLRKRVRHRIKLCIAIEERKQIQRREHLFKSKSHLHFRIPKKREKSRCTRLRVGGAVVSDQSQLLEVCTNHFQSLAHSQVNFECFNSEVIIVVLIHLS